MIYFIIKKTMSDVVSFAKTPKNMSKCYDIVNGVKKLIPCLDGSNNKRGNTKLVIVKDQTRSLNIGFLDIAIRNYLNIINKKIDKDEYLFILTELALHFQKKVLFKYQVLEGAQTFWEANPISTNEIKVENE